MNLPEGKFHMNADLNCVSVTYWPTGCGYILGTATASNFEQVGEDFWYVNRVKVVDGYQRRGLGPELVKRMAEGVREQGGRRLVVEPGGYGSDPKELAIWYRRQGFADVEPGRLDMMLTRDGLETIGKAG